MIMATECRQSSYKRASSALVSIRHSNKLCVIDRQNRSRDDIITRKRLKLNSLVEFDNCTFKRSRDEENGQVIDAIKCLKKGDKLQALTELHRLFASHQSNADNFLKHEGLQPLHSCFKSYDVEILYSSAWCVINLTAATSSSSSCSSSLLGLAPTLMQFLKGSDLTMQELCAWGLANLAGDSPSNADVLHKQGCTDALIDLLESNDLEDEERTKSVLFALINLARSNVCCVQCMHNKDVSRKLEVLLKRTSVDSTLNFEIGWLLCSLYSGCDETTFQTDHLSMATRIVSDRLNVICDGQRSPHSYKLCFPFVRCLCNLTGLNASMARVMLDDHRSSKTISDLLTSTSESLKQEILGLINNCMVDVCCRVLLALQPSILSGIISQCHVNGTDLTSQALLVIQAMARTSAHVDSYLLQNGVLLSTLTQIISNVALQMESGGIDSTEELLSRDEFKLVKISIGILLDLTLSQPAQIRTKLDREEPRQRSTTFSVLTGLASSTIQLIDPNLAHQAAQLLHLLEST